MIYNLFFKKLKTDFLHSLKIEGNSKKKIISIIDDLQENKARYLNEIDRRIRSSLIIFVVIISIIALGKFLNFQTSQLHLLLTNYTIWWTNLPSYISFFLPSKIINRFILSPNFIISCSFIILSLRIILLVFQYRNQNKIEIKIFEAIIENYFSIDHNLKSFLEPKLNEILDLPDHNNIKYSTNTYHCNYKNNNFQLFGIDLLDFDKIASYRPMFNILSAFIVKGKLESESQNLKFESNGIGNTTNNLKFKEYCLKIENYNKSYPIKYFDDKISNFFSKKFNYYDNSFPIKYIIYDNEFFIIIPKFRNLFNKKSIFDKIINLQDFVLTTKICEMIIELTENSAKYG